MVRPGVFWPGMIPTVISTPWPVLLIRETICYTQCLDPADPHFSSLTAWKVSYEILRNRQGQPYHLLPLPIPQPVYSVLDGKRLPATYTKFFITNHLVLVPFYEDPQDQTAQRYVTIVLSQTGK